MKKCLICNKEIEYPKRKYCSQKCGQKNYCIKNTEKILKRKRNYYYIHKEQELERTKKWRKKHREYLKEYHQEYRQKNKEEITIRHKNYKKSHKKQINECGRKYYQKNKEKMRNYQYNYYKLYPWRRSCYHAKSRCNNPNCCSYPRYGGKGIKFLMSVEDFKFLWFRDEAYLMKQPSIDRINNKGNYELNNCRYIELVDNSKRQHRN